MTTVKPPLGILMKMQEVNMEKSQTPLQEPTPLRAAERLADQTIVPGPRTGGDLLWAGLLPLHMDSEVLVNNRIVTITGSDPAQAAFGMMRTKLLQTMRENNWTSVAITSPTPSCGKTFVAANLAFALANQQDCRTVLVDLDLRQPGIGNVLGVDDLPSMELYLKGQSEIRDVFRRYGDNLAIGANSQSVALSAELLQSRDTARVLREMRQRMSPDIILFDLPPMQPNDDVLAFLPNVDCAVLVAAAEHSTLREVDTCEHTLSEKTNVLGVVLNKCRYGSEASC